MSAVVVEQISKQYVLGAAAGYRRLTEVLSGRLRRSARQEQAKLWALRDVSFRVAEGEVVGIVGRNGAGKSTLLKVLSRITEPTSGRATLRGRVGSLLEVGTGFHPELTGRENVFLNGAVLGMRRREIQSRFDEIVEFAEVQRFLDTPVKRFSSGMYVRLAFAVAAHLEPEILVVDEVLAVGDAAFQRKCLGKMSEVSKSGRTVLFVSHNMPAVQALCSRAILLDAGRLVLDGDVRDAVDTYLAAGGVTDNTSLTDRADREGTGVARTTSVTVRAVGGGAIVPTSELEIELDYEASAPLVSTNFAVGLFDVAGAEIYFLDSEAVPGLPLTLPVAGRIRVRTGPLNISPGRCSLSVAIVRGGLEDGGELLDRVEQAAVFDIEPVDMFGTGRVRPRSWALCVTRQEWTLDD